MRAKETLIYLTGADYLQQSISEERDLITQSTGRDDALPIEADLKTAGKVYAKRLGKMVLYPAVLASRITGIDAAQRKIRESLKKGSE